MRKRNLGLVLLLALLGWFVAVVPASADENDPGGDDGSVSLEDGTVDDTPDDGIPDNDPHLGCVFHLEWRGYDKGDDLQSTVTFTAHAPTGDGEVLLEDVVDIGGDAAGGAGDVDAAKDYDLQPAFEQLFASGVSPHNQGWHVKLEVHAAHSQGNDTKQKVFWVQDCRPGYLDVTKAVNGTDAAGGLSFDFTATCVTPAEGDDDIVWNGSVGDGQTVTSDPLPPDTTCSVVESTPPPLAGGTWGTPVVSDSPTGAIGMGEHAEVVITNTWTADDVPTTPVEPEVGQLTVTKTVTGGLSGEDQEALRFTMTIQCGDDDPFTVEMANGDTFVSDDLAAGTMCDVTETAITRDGADDSANWKEPAYADSEPNDDGNEQQVTVETDAGAQVDVTNVQNENVVLGEVVTPPQGEDLPRTGATSDRAALLGLELILLGFWAVLAGITLRRRNGDDLVLEPATEPSAGWRLHR